MKYKDDESDKIVDTSKAVYCYDLDTWDGHNYTYKGGVGLHAKLYRSPRGTWYVLNTSQWQGVHPSVEIISVDKAYILLISVGASDTELQEAFGDDYNSLTDKEV